MMQNLKLIGAFIADQTQNCPKVIIDAIERVALTKEISTRCTFHPGTKSGAPLQVHFLLGPSSSTLVPVGCCDAVLCLAPEEGLRAVMAFQGARYVLVGRTETGDSESLNEFEQLGCKVISPREDTRDPTAWLVGAALALPGSPVDLSELPHLSGMDPIAFSQGGADTAAAIKGAAL